MKVKASLQFHSPSPCYLISCIWITSKLESLHSTKLCALLLHIHQSVCKKIILNISLKLNIQIKWKFLMNHKSLSLKKNNEPWILKAKWFHFNSQHQNIMSRTGCSCDWYRPRITKTQAWAVYELYMVKFILVERSSLEFDIFFFFLFFIIRV